jgi:hypothetical protein
LKKRPPPATLIVWLVLKAFAAVAMSKPPLNVPQLTVLVSMLVSVVPVTWRLPPLNVIAAVGPPMLS